ncbi:MAG: hypothetical protein R2850_00065 [Bacteroidia bacterium]
MDSQKDEIDLRAAIQDKKTIHLISPDYPSLFDVKISNPAILSGFDLVFKLEPESQDFLEQCELTIG